VFGEVNYIGATCRGNRVLRNRFSRNFRAWFPDVERLSVQNLLSSRLLSKNLKITIHETIILPVLLYGCETWSLTLRKEQRLRVFENRVLRRVLGPKRDEVMREWR
jgi:hypothetical protein